MSSVLPPASSNPDNPGSPGSDQRSPSPDSEAIRLRSIARYRAHAARYDQTCQATWSFRERAIAHCQLEAGDVVVDVGCGTGLSFSLLRDAVGESGRVIGVEQSPEMADLARQKIAENGWDNITLINESAQSAQWDISADALLFNYTHDICRSRPALENLFSQSRHGARVGLAGVKYFPRWLAPLNLFVYLKNRPYNGSPGRLHRPWSIVEEFAPDLQIESTQLGMGYIAGGRLKNRAE